MEKGVERDLGGKIVVPGLVDIHVHLREPGYETKEDIASGTRAAAHGGFTAVCCMPNTKPVIDNAVGVEYVKARAAAVGKCRVHVAGSCSQGLAGDTLSEMGDMVAPRRRRLHRRRSRRAGRGHDAPRHGLRRAVRPVW